MLGTDDKYRAYKKRVSAGARAGEDRAALEKRLLEETEREGILAERAAETGGLLSKQKGVKAQ